MRAANRVLSKKVVKALSHVKGLDATGVFVKATDGNIILSGVVQQSGQIPLAVQAARNVDGVKSVHESLRLADQPTQ
ncbi:BON domain-containing protein [Paraburkholderia unamae]